MHTLDIFTRDIIQNSLQAIADEMFTAMRKAAMSPVIYEVLDMGTGITDAHGEIASSGAGIPAFVGVLDKAVKKIRQHHPLPQDIEEGDVFISNDPHDGAVTHLNDVVLAMPVFADGLLVAWTANIAHWNDVGGRVPGSLSTDATDIFQEGLRLGSVKLISKGQPIRSVLQILRANTRMPDFMEGDLWAGVAAVRGGAARLRELTEKYGTVLFLLAMKDFMDLGEKMSLKALATLPAGQLNLEELQDDGSLFKVRIDIRSTELVIDLRVAPAGRAISAACAGANSDQVSGIQGNAAGHAVTLVLTVFADDFDIIGRAFAALVQAPGRDDRTGVAAGHEAVIGTNPVVNAHAAATAELAVPAGFVIQRHALYIQPITRLTDFNGAVVGLTMQPGVNRIVAIAPGFCAPATDFRLHQGKHAAGVRVHAADDCGAHGSEIAGGQTVGKLLGQTAQDQVVHPNQVLEVKALCGRRHGVE
jgi:hypothetical protein